MTNLDEMLAGAKSHMDPNSLQYAMFLEAVAIAYPNFKVKKEPVIPLIETAIKIRKHLDPAKAPTDPNIAYDEFLIAYRLAALGGYFVTPTVESYNIFKRLSDKHDPSIKAAQQAILKVAYLLAADSSTREKPKKWLA